MKTGRSLNPNRGWRYYMHESTDDLSSGAVLMAICIGITFGLSLVMVLTSAYP